MLPENAIGVLRNYLIKQLTFGEVPVMEGESGPELPLSVAADVL